MRGGDAASACRIADGCERLVVERNAVAPVVALELRLHLAPHVKTLYAWSGSTGVDLTHDAVDAGLEAPHVLEGRDVDRDQQLPVVGGDRTVARVARLQSVSRAGKGLDSIPVTIASPPP
jgi:hypothetical protein